MELHVWLHYMNMSFAVGVLCSSKCMSLHIHVYLPFKSHVMVAATGEAELSPTPTPFNTACVVSVPMR